MEDTKTLKNVKPINGQHLMSESIKLMMIIDTISSQNNEVTALDNVYAFCGTQALIQCHCFIFTIC